MASSSIIVGRSYSMLLGKTTNAKSRVIAHLLAHRPLDQ